MSGDGMTNAQRPYAEVWLDADDLERVLYWYADSHSTGNPDEDELHDDLAERFKAAARDLAAGAPPE